jgi:hypothetical protein
MVSPLQVKHAGMLKTLGVIMNSNSILTESGRNKSLSEEKTKKPMAKSITHKIDDIPASVFLGLAAGAVALSIGLAVNRKKSWALVVGQWVPSILLLGIYNKAAKIQASEKSEHKSLLH